jgi:hypothetical protein
MEGHAAADDAGTDDDDAGVRGDRAHAVGILSLVTGWAEVSLAAGWAVEG